jgi:nucleoside triphosphate pyrophosphatase
MRLILASGSPRRAELLTAAGFTFEVLTPHVDESLADGEEPKTYVLRVARTKAAYVGRQHGLPGSVVLGADTVVVAAGKIMGKPSDRREAESMLKALSGIVHEVHTGVCLWREGLDQAEVVTTRVHFSLLTEGEIAWYVATGEPEGKAGAYAIQGRASRFIDRIDGSWSNVVGLPIATVYRMLRGEAP